MFMEIYKIYFKKPRGLNGFTLCCEDFNISYVSMVVTKNLETKQNIFCVGFLYIIFFYELN